MLGMMMTIVIIYLQPEYDSLPFVRSVSDSNTALLPPPSPRIADLTDWLTIYRTVVLSLGVLYLYTYIIISVDFLK